MNTMTMTTSVILGHAAGHGRGDAALGRDGQQRRGDDDERRDAAPDQRDALTQAEIL
jgi:hypothetical protein